MKGRCWDAINKDAVTQPSAAINPNHLPVSPSVRSSLRFHISLSLPLHPTSSSSCLTLSCLRASICLQSFPPSPHTPYSSPSTQISFHSLSLPQFLPSSHPVWLEPWLVQLSIMKAKPCQGRLNPEALLYPHCLLFYLSQSPSFNKFVPVNKPSKMTPSP